MQKKKLTLDKENLRGGGTQYKYLFKTDELCASKLEQLSKYYLGTKNMKKMLELLINTAHKQTFE